MSARLSCGFSRAHLSPSVDGAVLVDQLLAAASVPSGPMHEFVRLLLHEQSPAALDEHYDELLSQLETFRQRTLDDSWPLDLLGALPDRLRGSRVGLRRSEAFAPRHPIRDALHPFLGAAREALYRNDPIGFLLVLYDSRCPYLTLLETVHGRVTPHVVLASVLYPVEAFGSSETRARMRARVASGFDRSDVRFQILEESMVLDAFVGALEPEPESAYRPVFKLVESALGRLQDGDSESFDTTLHRWNTMMNGVGHDDVFTSVAVRSSLRCQGQPCDDEAIHAAMREAREAVLTDWDLVYSRLRGYRDTHDECGSQRAVPYR